MPFAAKGGTCMSSTVGLVGLDRVRSRKSEAGEADMLQAYSAPPVGRTASFGRTAAMDLEYLNAPLLPRATGGARDVGERAERGAREEEGEEEERAKEGGCAGRWTARDMYARAPVLEEESEWEAREAKEAKEGMTRAAGTPRWGRRDGRAGGGRWGRRWTVPTDDVVAREEEPIVLIIVRQRGGKLTGRNQLRALAGGYM